MKQFLIILWCLLLAALPLAAQSPSAQSAGEAKPAPTAAQTLLPNAFSGWQKSSTARSGTSASVADTANAALLTELGFTDFESATFDRPGRKLSITAFRFADTTGAFAAFSVYGGSEMAKEKFCGLSASTGNTILFACTNVLVRAEYDKITAMSPAEMRSLAEMIPRSTGSAAVAPNLPLYLPEEVRKSFLFAIGPVGLSRTTTPLPSSVIDFDRGAEVVVSPFTSPRGPAVLTLVKYPTFKMAIERQRVFDDFSKSLPAAKEGTAPTFHTRRIGPLVAVVSGSIALSDAKELVEKISYDAEITENEPGYSKKDNMANLLVNIIYLCLIAIVFAFVTGVAFGGLRIFMRWKFPNSILGRESDAEVIRLKLNE